MERDVMEYDVVVVGAGPAGMTAAMRLKQKAPDKRVCVLEKAARIGGHSLSGAVIDTAPLDQLVPNWRSNPPDPCVPAREDRFRYLTRSKSIRLPTPPQQRNRGNVIVSLSQLMAWLAPRAEALGVELYPGFPAADVVFNDRGAVAGVRTPDMGLDINNRPKDSYTPGIEIHASMTVLAEGCRGHCSKQLIDRFKLDIQTDPQTYALGLKELWRVPSGRAHPGRSEHTVGWPLPSDTYGGGFIYHLDDDRLALGWVVGLDYPDPGLEPFELFQDFKQHPSIRRLLDGGELLAAGDRTLVEGGWQSLPTMEMPGAILLGDSAGLLNVPRIKGVHNAMRSGLIAADHLSADRGSAGFNAAIRRSAIGAELYRVRNIRPGFKKGLKRGLANAAWETVSRGVSPWTLRNHADWRATRTLAEQDQMTRDDDAPSPTHDLAPRDRAESVHFAQTEHAEDQPVHLQIIEPDICINRCTREFGNPCTRFCPARVFEMVDDGVGHRRLQINASNCVHCKACDIKDPYQIINWVTPEGGAGPNYEKL